MDNDTGKLLGLIETPAEVDKLSNGQLLGLLHRITDRREFEKEIEQLSFHLHKEILTRMRSYEGSVDDMGGYHD